MSEGVPSCGMYEAMKAMHPLIIKEGLIMTYPTEMVIKSIAEHYNLSVNGETNEISSLLRGSSPGVSGDIKTIYPNGEDEIIVVKLPRGSEIFDGINSHMLKYGWFNFRTDENDGVEYMFEKKFGDRFTVGELSNMTEKIYHITSSRLKKKILSQGLVPKASKTPGFINEPRIYFRLDLPSIDMARGLMNMKFENEPPVVFEVNLKSLNPKQAFFFDPRWGNSIFTFEPIPPTALTAIEEKNLPPFKINY